MVFCLVSMSVILPQFLFAMAEVTVLFGIPLLVLEYFFALQIDENVMREIINHRSLRHPNIVRFKEVNTALSFVICLPCFILDLVCSLYLLLYFVEFFRSVLHPHTWQ